MKLRWKCNLDDVMRREIWPEYLPELPRVGDHIQSAQHYRGRREKLTGELIDGERSLELVVVRVTIKDDKNWRQFGDTPNESNWYAEVELHLPKNHFEHISAFEKWYNSLVM